MKNLYKNITLVFTSFLLVTQLFTVHAMEMFPKETFKFQFSNQSGSEFTEVDKELAMQFATIATIIKDADDQDVLIPVQGITSSMWVSVQNFLLPREPTHIRFMQPRSAMRVAMGLMSPSTRGIKTMQGDLTGFKDEDLKNMILTLNYLNPNSNQALFLFDKAIDRLFEQVIKPNIVSPSKITTITAKGLPTFSPDGKILAVKQRDNTIKLWNISDSKNPSKIVTSTDITGMHATFSPDGKTLAAKQRGDTTKLWDISNSNNPSEIVTITTGGIPTFSPDGKILAVWQPGNIPKLWDISDPKNPSEIVTITGSYVTFSPDGKILAAKQHDDTTKLWDLSDPKNPSKIVTITTEGLPTFSPDGKTLAAKQHDDTTKLWDISDSNNPSEIVTITTGGLPTFSPDGKTLAIGKSDNIIKLWDVSDPKNPSEIVTSTIITGAYAKFSPDGKILSVNQRGNIIKLWNISDSKNPSEIVVSTIITGSYVAFSPDGKIFAIKHLGDDIIKLWNLYPLPLLDCLNTMQNIQNNTQFRESIIAVFNIIKDPSQRTEENYNKFPDAIREEIRKLFPPQGILEKYVAPWLRQMLLLIQFQ